MVNYDSNSSDDESTAPPIRDVARHRSKKGTAATKCARRHYVSPLFDNRGYPYPQNDWESMLPDVKSGRLVRKRLRDPPKLQDIDPDSGEEYNEAKNGDILRAELLIAHLTPHQRSISTAVVKKY
jgi:hypothetical protein